MTNGVAFFVGEGLFFLGLSLGIVGTTSDDRARQAAWILMCLGGLSLLVAGLIVTYRKRKPSVSSNSRLAPLRPMSLTRAFDSLLHTSQSSTLLEGESFRSELFMLLSPLKIDLAPHTELILQHFSGLGASVEVELQTSDLRGGELLRISSGSDARRVLVEAVDESDDIESTPSKHRAPQILAHFINDKALN